MKRCLQCGGKFGLIRHALRRGRFCSKLCLETYKRDQERKSRWQLWLYHNSVLWKDEPSKACVVRLDQEEMSNISDGRDLDSVKSLKPPLHGR
jgi:hypothetical protein